MRRMRWICLAAFLVVLASSMATAQDTPVQSSPSGAEMPFEPPAWAKDMLPLLAAAGGVVLIATLVLRIVRGRVLTQMRPNFTPWGPLEIAVIGLTWVLLNMVPPQVIMWAGSWTPATLPTGWFLSTNLVAALVAFSLAVWLMRRLFGLGLENFGFRRENHLLAVGLALLGLLAAAPVQFVIGQIYGALNIRVDQAQVQEIAQRSGMGLVLAAVLAVLVAPVIEEFIFRGVVQMGVRKYLGSWGAILFSGALFAVVHPPLAISGMIFPLGVVLGYLYQRRQSLAAPILLHMLFNAITIVVVVAWRLAPD